MHKERITVNLIVEADRTIELRREKSLHPELLGLEEPIVEFPKGKVMPPNPAKVKTGTRPRAAHEVPLLTATANRMMDMEDAVGASESSGTPSTLDKECNDRGGHARAKSGKGSGRNGAPCEQKALQKGKRRDRGKCTTQGVEEGSCRLPSCIGCPRRRIPNSRGIRYGLDRLHDWHPGRSYLCPKPVFHGESEVREIVLISLRGRVAKDIYQAGWVVTNNCLLNTPAACQDMVEYIVPSGYYLELRHLPNADFLSQYNKNLAQQVAMGSQLRLRFEQEVRDVKAESDDLRNRTKNLDTLFEAKVDMKKAAEARNVKLAKELKSIRVQFADLWDSNIEPLVSPNLSALSTTHYKDTECVVLSFDYKLPDENHVFVRVPRENNMYNVDLENVVPLGDLTCLFAKATLDESNLCHRRLGYISFKTMNKLVKGIAT
nr:ribonuclease H-like domain-containing protein [Tanacetum cinerariifolium]